MDLICFDEEALLMNIFKTEINQVLPYFGEISFSGPGGIYNQCLMWESPALLF